MTAEPEAPPAMSRLQFWALLATALGVFVVPSVVHLLRGGPLGETTSDRGLLEVVALELVIGAAWATRLARQGWTLASVTEPFVPRDLSHAVLLSFATWTAYSFAFALTLLVAPAFAEAAREVRFDGQASWPVAILVSVVNPIYEELIYLGVVAASLRRQTIPLALSGSLVARVVVHLYQGPLGIIGTVPMGLVFGAYYLKTRRLWPLVIAHGLLDILAFGALASGES